MDSGDKNGKFCKTCKTKKQCKSICDPLEIHLSTLNSPLREPHLAIYGLDQETLPDKLKDDWPHLPIDIPNKVRAIVEMRYGEKRLLKDIAYHLSISQTYIKKVLKKYSSIEDYKKQRYAADKRRRRS